MMAADALQSEHRLIVAGSGGQGILTFCKLLCSAAVKEGRNVTYLPSYGPEVRSGTARCRVIISPDIIHSPLVEETDSLIVFNQSSCDRFAPTLRPGGLLLVNSSAVEAQDAGAAKVLALPATDLAAEMGSVKVANSILLGAFVSATGVVSEESCLDALTEHWGRRRADMADLNVQALKRGVELVVKGATAPLKGRKSG